jgi:hypothetical protein
MAEDLVRALLSRGVDLTTANLEGMIERGIGIILIMR